MGIFKDDDESKELAENMTKQTEDQDLSSLFQEDDSTEAEALDDANVDKDLLDQIFSGDQNDSDDLDKELEAQFAEDNTDDSLDDDLDKLLGEIESIEDAAKESAAKEETKMNKKKKKEKKQPEPVVEETPVEEPKKEEKEETTVSSDATTVISEGTTIEGGITSEVSIEVMGTIKGDIESKGKVAINGTVNGSVTAAEIYVNTPRLEGALCSEGTVQISDGTVVVGDIIGASAYIAGAVKGNIDVNGAITLDSSAIIKGDINAKSIQVNEGAILDGHCILSYSDIDIDAVFEEKK
ncbi:MAG: polymer-forming cytoskeletal protein [Lachnospiraceae bacterium]|nr:polymer-forming cytoskeletal protein [Lachnospiraceae bacterium]